jgi:AcrR family transcriptional regulator
MSDIESRIFDAAEGLFARYGLRKTTIEDIAREAGIGKGTVYNYFPSKEEIFLAVKRHECEQDLDALRTAAAVGTTAAERLVGFVRTRIQRVEQSRGRHRITGELISEFVTQPEYEQIRSELRRGEEELLRGIIAAGAASGELSAPDLDAACWVVRVLISGLETITYFEPGEYEDRMALACQALLDGLRRR